MLKVTQLKKRLVREERVVELPQHLRQKLTDEILNRLRSLDSAANSTKQRGEYKDVSSFIDVYPYLGLDL